MALVLSSKRSREVVIKERRRNCNFTPISGGGTPSLVPELPVDPEQVIQQREKEKSMLVEVNRMLADYIGKVEFYKTENARLNKDVAELEKKYKEINEKLKAKYDGELEKMREELKEEKAEKETWKVKTIRIEDELVILKEKLDKEEQENAKLKDSIPSFEQMISERDAQIDFLTKTATSMEEEIKRLKETNLRIKKDFALLRQEGDGDAIAKVELASQLQSKDDELSFLSSAHDEWRRSILPFEVASENYAKEFSNELASTLRDIRAEYEEILHATESQNSNDWYKQKFDQLISMTKTQTSEVDALKQKLRQAREQNDALTVSVRHLETQAKINEANVNELRRLLAKEEEEHQNTRDDLNFELQRKMAEIHELMEELRELTHIRHRLDEELATYKRLLDVACLPRVTLANFPIPRLANENELCQEFYQQQITKQGHVTGNDINSALGHLCSKQKGKVKRERNTIFVDNTLALMGKARTLSFEEFLISLELEKVFYAKEKCEKEDAAKSGTLKKDVVLRLLGECPYKVDGHNFLEKFLQAGDPLTPGMVDYPKMFTEALKCLGVDTKAL